MNDEEVVAIIIKELLVIMPNASDIVSETNIVRDLSLDSLAVMDLVMALEDYFDISIPLDRIADTETVFQLAGVVQSLQTEVRA
ncbi:MAG: phosphopantetheine-binding protein [Tateyamaria sp.]|mgnify:FL=1|nr:phosphopantetheine-binding protein [Tateyamaria sp.]MDG0982822.1 phosphopantetheine-binding protein [Tateyamaria sp.]MDG1420327.1 phosphopantetheine-binding protein [Tateyamaria sp.]MDG1678951.1 phosphopantetheine-binding protein [Tateyamaria sp.]